MIQAKNLNKVYFNGSKELRVLKNINLAISKGEVLSIVGPSGAGKSTLLHILGGLDDATDGEVLFDNVAFSGLDDAQKARIRNSKIGFVFQFYHLMREFSALENVMMPALLRKESGFNEIKDKALAILDFLGLSERVQHKPFQLSGGEQQRVAIARALINDPQVLFCDEPTGNLDYESGKQIRQMLLSLNHKKSTTVLIVTHSKELAGGSHRVLNIFDGSITN